MPLIFEIGKKLQTPQINVIYQNSDKNDPTLSPEKKDYRMHSIPDNRINCL